MSNSKTKYSVEIEEHKTDLPNNWKQSINVYSGDDLIDAYLQGKKAGHSERARILLNQLNDNIIKARKISEKLYEKVSDKKILLRSIHLKAEDITLYKALIIVDKDNFLQDNFREVYILANQMKNESKTDNFSISFSFMPFSNNLSEDCLLADGFFTKYEKK